MSKIDFTLPLPNLPADLTKAVRREQTTALFDLPSLAGEGTKQPDTMSEEAFRVLLKQYDGNSARTAAGTTGFS